METKGGILRETMGARRVVNYDHPPTSPSPSPSPSIETADELEQQTERVVSVKKERNTKETPHKREQRRDTKSVNEQWYEETHSAKSGDETVSYVSLAWYA